MNKILVVEDDQNLALGIQYALKNEGFEAEVADRVKPAQELLEKGKYDMVLLDIMLPDGTGYDLCREIRKVSDMPVIFLTACDEEVNIIMGLDMGGDDYITKPFRVRELISRIKAVLRRNSCQAAEEGNILASGNIQVHTLEGKVKKENIEVLLTAQEYKLLLTFINHPRQVLRRSYLLEVLWDIDGEFIDDNTLSVYIRRLREKIEDNPDKPAYISTVRGVGYRWDITVRRGK